MSTRSHAAPIITALFPLAVLYVGRYLLLVKPYAELQGRVSVNRLPAKRYRVWAKQCSQIFLPLELVDQWVRPALWDEPAH